MVFLFGALTPVLLALQDMVTERKLFHVLALFSSFAVVFVASLLRSFHFQERWVDYRTTAEILKKERYYYDARAQAYETAADCERLFVMRVESIIGRQNAVWTEAMSKNDGETVVAEGTRDGGAGGGGK
jgi:hypothetical protein